MKTQVVPLSQIKPNPNNPRVLNKVKFEKLKQSIEALPQMLHLRPIVVNEHYTILGGNMRYKALIELGYEEVPVIVASELSLDQQREFLIKDNLNYGEWDYDELANEWDSVELEEWGMNVWQNLDDLEMDSPKDSDPITDDKEVCALCGK